MIIHVHLMHWICRAIFFLSLANFFPPPESTSLRKYLRFLKNDISVQNLRVSNRCDDRSRSGEIRIAKCGCSHGSVFVLILHFWFRKPMTYLSQWGTSTVCGPVNVFKHLQTSYIHIHWSMVYGQLSLLNLHEDQLLCFLRSFCVFLFILTT